MYTPNTTCWNWTSWICHCCFRNLHGCAPAAWHAKTGTGVYCKCGKRIYSTSRFLQDLCTTHSQCLVIRAFTSRVHAARMKCILQPSLYIKVVTHCVWMQAQARFCVRSCLPFHRERSCKLLLSHLPLVFSFTWGWWGRFLKTRWWISDLTVCCNSQEPCGEYKHN